MGGPMHTITSQFARLHVGGTPPTLAASALKVRLALLILPNFVDLHLIQ